MQARWQINVRRSFATKLDEQKPANIAYVTAGKQEDLYNVDLAVAAYNPKGSRFRIAPVAEWHRDFTAEKPKNKLQAGGVVDGRAFAAGSLRIDLRGTANLIHNFKTDATGGVAALMLSPYHADPTAFNASTIRVRGLVKGTFYPYVGAELWQNLKVGEVAGVDTTVGVMRFEAKVFPGNRSPQGVDSRFELGASYTYRHPFSEDGLRDAYHLVTLDANWFVDPAHHVALGFSYQNGADPEKDYTIGHKGVVSLKFKI
jgi:hypothetical protein